MSILKSLEGKCCEENNGIRFQILKCIGRCKAGYRCRYLNAHLKDGKLVIDEEVWLPFQRFNRESTTLTNGFSYVACKEFTRNYQKWSIKRDTDRSQE